MRWKKPSPPKAGDTRTRRVFAWKRKAIGEYIVWLEFYAVTERFYQPVGGTPGWWAHERNALLDYYG